MASINLEQADAICAGAEKYAKEHEFQPITVAVYDGGGALRVLRQPDPGRILFAEMAMAKGWGAFAMGMPGRTIAERHAINPNGIDSLRIVAGGKLPPVIGGVLIKDGDGNVIGAVGATGDLGERDEACAIAGIKAAGLIPDPAEASIL
ncbi:MAG: heme-binding protein [Proteobacteria bacterium]|nr:heme-binding protein [Pseudomonadota bacterium]